MDLAGIGLNNSNNEIKNQTQKQIRILWQPGFCKVGFLFLTFYSFPDKVKRFLGVVRRTICNDDLMFCELKDLLEIVDNLCCKEQSFIPECQITSSFYLALYGLLMRLHVLMLGIRYFLSNCLLRISVSCEVSQVKG